MSNRKKIFIAAGLLTAAYAAADIESDRSISCTIMDKIPDYESSIRDYYDCSSLHERPITVEPM